MRAAGAARFVLFLSDGNMMRSRIVRRTLSATVKVNNSLEDLVVDGTVIYVKWSVTK
jgi:hypothetical protein